MTAQLIRDALQAAPEGLSGAELANACGRKDAAFTAAREALVAAGEVLVAPRPGRGGGRLYLLDRERSGAAPRGSATAAVGTFDAPVASPVDGCPRHGRRLRPEVCYPCAVRTGEPAEGVR